MILTLAIAFGITTLGFSNNDIKEDKTPQNKIESKSQVLSAEEIQLELELSEELEISVADVLEELQQAAEVTELWVYDLDGNLIQAQSGKIDFSLIPINAELLMTEGGIQYYIIAR